MKPWWRQRPYAAILVGRGTKTPGVRYRYERQQRGTTYKAIPYPVTDKPFPWELSDDEGTLEPE
jgi:hypothetical protein